MGADLRVSRLTTGTTTSPTSIASIPALIAELKKGTKGNEELQGKVTAYEKQVADLQAQLTATQLENAVQLAIRDAGGADVDYLAFKLKAAGELELDESGKIKGIDEKMTALKAQCPTQFETGNGGKLKVDVHKLPGVDEKSTEITKEEFDKMGYNSRVKLKEDNPELYTQLTKG